MTITTERCSPAVAHSELLDASPIAAARTRLGSTPPRNDPARPSTSNRIAPQQRPGRLRTASFTRRDGSSGTPDHRSLTSSQNSRSGAHICRFPYGAPAQPPAGGVPSPPAAWLGRQRPDTPSGWRWRRARLECLGTAADWTQPRLHASTAEILASRGCERTDKRAHAITCGCSIVAGSCSISCSSSWRRIPAIPTSRWTSRRTSCSANSRLAHDKSGRGVVLDLPQHVVLDHQVLNLPETFIGKFTGLRRRPRELRRCDRAYIGRRN